MESAMKRIVSKTFVYTKKLWFSSIHCSGFWLLLKGNILEKLPAQITHAGDWEILEGIKWTHSGGFHFWRVMYWFFIIPPQILARTFCPLQIPRGSFILCQVNRRKNNASFRRHFLDFFAFSPLEKLSLPTGLTHQMVGWHIRDMRWESRTKLFGKHLANIWKYTSPHSTQMFFWHVFGSIWFLQFEEEKSLELIMSVSICASGQGTKNFDRYR